MKMWLLPLLAAMIGGCDSIPRDPDGTLERVRGDGRFRVGLVAPLGAGDAALARSFLGGVAAAASARPELERGAAEPLLKRLEGGELDLVIGALDAKSPWKTMVSFLPPLAERETAHGPIHLLAVAPNGENAWISLLDAEAREVGPK